jgi:hypothetical protein
VLSEGHASTLLRPLLRLPQVKAIYVGYEVLPRDGDRWEVDGRRYSGESYPIFDFDVYAGQLMAA